MANLDQILSGGGAGCQSPVNNYPVVQVMNANPLACPQNCPVPVETAGRSIVTTLTTDCIIELGPFTNATSANRIIAVGGAALYGTDNVNAYINTGLIRGGATAAAYFNADLPVTEAIAELWVLQKYVGPSPYIFSAIEVQIEGETETIKQSQFNRNILVTHIEPNLFDACFGTIKAPSCNACPDGGFNEQYFTTCQFYAGPQDIFEYPVVPGATVSLRLCVCANARSYQYVDCATPGAPGYTAAAPALRYGA